MSSTVSSCPEATFITRSQAASFVAWAISASSSRLAQLVHDRTRRGKPPGSGRRWRRSTCVHCAAHAPRLPLRAVNRPP
jgi:hypothetical protein